MIILSIIVSYICIKLIDNYIYVLEVVNGFLKVLSPFIVGVILAYILNPLVNFLENKLDFKRGLSIFVTISFTILTICLFIVFITPILVESVLDLFNQSPIYLEQVQKFLEYFSKEVNSLYNINIEKFILNQIEILKPEMIEISKGIINKVITITLSTTTIVINSILAMVVCIYVLADKENYILYFKKVNKIIFKEKVSKINNFINLCNEKVGKYMIAKR